MGVPEDPKLAALWYQRAAEQGMDNAQLLLGIMYAKGQGEIKANYEQAYAWINLAATSSNDKVRDAALNLKKDLEKNMQPDEIEAARKLSQGFYSKYADS